MPQRNKQMLIKKNVSLADKNWFKTGGYAHWYTEPRNEIEMAEALQFAKNASIPVYMLGDGANVLISDQGFDGLVIKPMLKTITVDAEHGHITAQAGVLIKDLIDTSLANNLIGLEEFSGIPGSVGGSVYINIHYFSFLLSDFLTSARVIEKNSGTIETVDHAWFNFGYDHSKLFEKNYYLIEATFKVKKGDDFTQAFARGRQTEIIRHRNNRYPTSNTCGSFFRNFHEHEIIHSINGKKIPFVAYYLDKLGIKGELTMGKASVSHQHANMIVTKPGATSTDVVGLACKMQDMVYDCFELLPQPECQLIGFVKNPFEHDNSL